MNEIHSFLEKSGCLIILCPHPTEIATNNGKLSTDEWIPIEGFQSIGAQGRKIDFRGSELFKRYWDKCSEFHLYNAYFDTSIGTPFLFVHKHGDKAVGTSISLGHGHIVLLPDLDWDDLDDQDLSTFIDAVCELSRDLQKENSQYSLPNWVDDLLLPGESETRGKLSKINTEIERLNTLREEHAARLSELREYKILLGGRDTPLEKQVPKVLEQIGFEVQPGNNNREDLIITYNESVAVVEIKGHTKSGQEKDSRQLETWVNEYLEHNGDKQKVKGILLLNAYCHTPIEKRKGKAPFPRSMQGYSERNEHCLITTVQLLGLYYHLQEHPEEKDQLIHEIFETNGVYKKFCDELDF